MRKMGQMTIVETNITLPVIEFVSNLKVAYKSERAPIKATKSLINTIAQAFYERCGVGLLDMDYPVNKQLFGDLISDSPSIIYKGGIFLSAMIFLRQVTLRYSDRIEKHNTAPRVP